MINEPSAAGGADLETLVQQLAGEYEGGEGGGEAMDEGDVPPGANVVEVHLSPEEVEAVERLVGLGFDRQVGVASGGKGGEGDPLSTSAVCSLGLHSV